MTNIHIDGSINHPGCKCGVECEMPCWQRVGIAPACESCGCVAFPYDYSADPNDRADDFRAMPDIWPEILVRIPDAINDPTTTINGRGIAFTAAFLEEKFRKGEAEHDRGWLDMTREQIEHEITNEWADLVLYHAMLRARFPERDETVTEDTPPA